MEMLEMAKVALAAFEWAERPNGDRYIRIREGSPEWVKDMMHDCHDDMFPDDYRYEYIYEALDSLVCEDGDESSASEHLHSNDLLGWLGSHPKRIGEVNDWITQNGWAGDLTTAIEGAQMTERFAVLSQVAEWLYAHA